MSALAAHIAGVPFEEMVLGLFPALSAFLLALRAR